MIGESTVNENAARYVRRVGPVVIPEPQNGVSARHLTQLAAGSYESAHRMPLLIRCSAFYEKLRKKAVVTCRLQVEMKLSVVPTRCR